MFLEQRLHEMRKKLEHEFDGHSLGSLGELILEYIDAKVENECRDLYDRIKERGQWSPDY